MQHPALTCISAQSSRSSTSKALERSEQRRGASMLPIEHQPARAKARRIVTPMLHKGVRSSLIKLVAINKISAEKMRLLHTHLRITKMLAQLLLHQKPALIENNTFWFNLPHPTNPTQHLQIATRTNPNQLTTIFHSHNYNTLRTAQTHHFKTHQLANNYIQNFLNS